MKLKVKEKQIENEILSWLKWNGIFAWKNESVGIFDQRKGVYRMKHSIHRVVGISDILGIFSGRFLAIEVKSKNGKLTDAQRQFLIEVNNQGGIGILARSVEEVQLALVLNDPEFVIKMKV